MRSTQRSKGENNEQRAWHRQRQHDDESAFGSLKKKGEHSKQESGARTTSAQRRKCVRPTLENDEERSKRIAHGRRQHNGGSACDPVEKIKKVIGATRIKVAGNTRRKRGAGHSMEEKPKLRRKSSDGRSGKRRRPITRRFKAKIHTHVGKLLQINRRKFYLQYARIFFTFLALVVSLPAPFFSYT